jgi:hypothetical protein
MLRHLILGEAVQGLHRTDPHRYAEFMCSWSARFRRLGRAFR